MKVEVRFLGQDRDRVSGWGGRSRDLGWRSRSGYGVRVRFRDRVKVRFLGPSWVSEQRSRWGSVSGFVVWIWIRLPDQDKGYVSGSGGPGRGSGSGFRVKIEVRVLGWG